SFAHDRPRAAPDVGRRPHRHRSGPRLAASWAKGEGKAVVFLRFGGALFGFFFGFFLAAQLLQVSQVTPPNNQVLVVFLLAVACAILGWLGAPYATVKPMGWLAGRIRATAAGDLAAGVLGGGVGLVLALFLAFPLSFLPGELGRFAPLVGAVALSALGVTAG